MKFSESTLKLPREAPELGFTKTKFGVMLNKCIMHKMKCGWFMIDTNKLKLLLDGDKE